MLSTRTRKPSAAIFHRSSTVSSSALAVRVTTIGPPTSQIEPLANVHYKWRSIQFPFKLISWNYSGRILSLGELSYRRPDIRISDRNCRPVHPWSDSFLIAFLPLVSFLLENCNDIAHVNGAYYCGACEPDGTNCYDVFNNASCVILDEDYNQKQICEGANRIVLLARQTILTF